MRFRCDEVVLEVNAPWVSNKNEPFQLSFNASLKVDFKKIPGHFGGPALPAVAFRCSGPGGRVSAGRGKQEPPGAMRRPAGRGLPGFETAHPLLEVRLQKDAPQNSGTEQPLEPLVVDFHAPPGG